MAGCARGNRLDAIGLPVLLDPWRFDQTMTSLMARRKRGQIAPGRLFNLTVIRAGVISDELSDWLGVPNPKPDPLTGLFNLTAKTPVALPVVSFGTHAHHNSRIGSTSLEVADPIPADVFDFWLDRLITLKGPNILRIKGIVHLEGIEWPFVFHGVQHIFDAPVPLKSWSGKGTKSRVMVIARHRQERLEGQP